MTDAPSNLHGVVTGPREVRFERLLPGAVERVWTYLTDPDLRGRWLASGPMELRVGGRTELKFRHAALSDEPETPPERFREMNENGAVQLGEVLACDPPRLLSITWGSPGVDASEVTFSLAPEGDQTRLTILHRKLADRGAMVNVSGGWHTHLAVLEDEIAGRPRRPFWATWLGKEEDYDARLPRDL